jgi:hypothetical protein
VTVILLIIVIAKKIKNQDAPKKMTTEKYNSTMVSKMVDVTNSENAMFNIWPFVNGLKKIKILPRKLEEHKLVYKVYRNENFEHVLLNTEKENHFVVIVSNLNKTKVKGYYLVNLLNKEYTS